ncbi:hypothetical protein BDV59DRAFT_195179 [Aspergillus ambiguus]|uniref:uncharacterized protein n=1 Tax=Aspergillus ambiguus TaxID=176160 RepID=UPI003CCD535E
MSSLPDCTPESRKDNSSCTAIPESPRYLATSLVTRCRTLIAEIKAFQSLLAETQRNPQVVEVRSLLSNAVSELRTLEKLADKIHSSASAEADNDDGPPDDNWQRLTHALRSSNLPFYEAVWTIAKRTCTGLVAFGKRFYWDGGSDGWDEGKKRPNKDKQKSVFVDIVADDGEEWVKVSTVSETRLLFEMAEKGWEGHSEGGSEEEERIVLRNYDDDRSFDSEDEDDDEVELVKLAIDMRKTANNTRIRYRHPRLRFVIPKIEEGKNQDIDDLFEVIRGYGITVECGEAVSSIIAPSDYNVQEELRRLLPKPFKRFTPTLNVDCTLLLAMASDLSHFKDLTPTPDLHKAIVRQLEIERERPLLTKELWPAMVGYELICTGEAAKRMREIVDVIGTEAEKTRMKILMGDAPFNGLDRESVIRKFQELSDYQIPSQWKIPIKTVDSRAIIDAARSRGALPPVSERVTEILSDINYSVFMYGWATNTMTISSNRTVVKHIENIVEKHRDGDENLEGPLIWVCDTARSLIGKEKGRKK